MVNVPENYNGLWIVCQQIMGSVLLGSDTQPKKTMYVVKPKSFGKEIMDKTGQHRLLSGDQIKLTNS